MMRKLRVKECISRTDARLLPYVWYSYTEGAIANGIYRVDDGCGHEFIITHKQVEEFMITKDFA